jgi:hypothetical protein
VEETFNILKTLHGKAQIFEDKKEPMSSRSNSPIGQNILKIKLPENSAYLIYTQDEKKRIPYTAQKRMSGSISLLHAESICLVGCKPVCL